MSAFSRCTVAMAIASLSAPAGAVTLLLNAHIYSMDAAHPAATAMAWDDAGKLLAVGDSTALQKQYADAKRIDAHSATVVPGLIDAPGHMLDLGRTLTQADLVGSASVADAIARLRSFATTLPKGRMADRPRLGPESLARRRVSERSRSRCRFSRSTGLPEPHR